VTKLSLRTVDDFPFLEDKIYFNCAADGAVPESTTQVIERYFKDYASQIRGKPNPDSPDYDEVKANSKRLFAEIIGAKTEEIAFVPNATTGINTAFGMIPFEKGDNIVLSDLSYPMGATIVTGYERKGVESRFVKHRDGEVETSQWEKVITDETKAVMIDQPGWFNGFLYDLKDIADIAHSHGAYLVVDGTQSVGQMCWDIHKTGVDFLATSTYKWLLGGPYANTTGFFYVRGEHIEELSPDYVGSQTLPREKEVANQEDAFSIYEFSPRKDIGKIEVYSKNQLGYVSVENSMRVLLKYGVRNAENHIKKVDTVIVDGLLENGIKLQTPVAEDKRFYLNALVSDYKTVCASLREENVYISPRVGGLRISPAAYNEIWEAEEFVEKLVKYQ
jgi:selenocysteine lyase/cysteine desulfurase